MERREAQRPTSLAARTPEAARPWRRGYCRECAWRAARLARQANVSLLTVGGDPPWRLPALHPSQEGNGKQGYGLTRAPENKSPGGRSVGCLTIESELAARSASGFFRGAALGGFRSLRRQHGDRLDLEQRAVARQL